MIVSDVLRRCEREDPVEGLVLLARDREMEPDFRAGIVHLLSDEHGCPQSVSPLMDILRTDPAPEVRAKAAQELAFLMFEDRASEILALLVEALRDPSEEVRVEAMRALVRIGGPMVVDALTPLVNDREIGPYAREVLGDIERFGKPGTPAAGTKQ